MTTESVKSTIYGYGGGNYTRFSAKTTSKIELYKKIDEALNKGYTALTINVGYEEK